MHVMTKYIDTKKAAIEALRDYPTMETIINTTTADIKQAVDDATHVSSIPTDSQPRTRNPHAHEERICATLDKIDLYKTRYAQACQYMDWFLPAWAILTDDERTVLEGFFLTDKPKEQAVNELADHFYIERTSVYTKKNRALSHLARALYG